MRAALLSIGLLAGCNQLLGVDDVTSDGPDAGDDDGPTSNATRAGLVTLFDVTLTDPEATECCSGLRGGELRAHFEDLTQHGGEVIYGTSPVDGCLLTRYDETHLPHPDLDGGAITISGDGLLKTVGPCIFFASPRGYLCISADVAGATVTATAAAAGVVNFHLEGADFSNQDLIGSHLLIQGFNDPFLQGAFAIIGQPSIDELTASVPGAAMGATETATGIQYGVANAAAPSPVFNGLDQDFLGGASSTITVTKPAVPDAAAIAFTTYPRAEGYELDMLSTAPDAFPTTAQDVRYSCDRTGGKCGAEGDAEREATVVFGHATRSSTAGVFAFDMPYEEAGAEYLDLRCVYPSSDAGTIPAAAVQQILDFGPTRIEIEVARVTMVTIADPANADNVTDVLVGHALIGHTDL